MLVLALRDGGLGVVFDRSSVFLGFGLFSMMIPVFTLLELSVLTLMIWFTCACFTLTICVVLYSVFIALSAIMNKTSCFIGAWSVG